MTQGRARQTQGRENGHDHIARHRPRGAAARGRRILLQTQGLSRNGCFAPRDRALTIASGLGRTVEEISRGLSTKRTRQEWGSFMAIVNALAGIMVSDLTTA